MRQTVYLIFNFTSLYCVCEGVGGRRYGGGISRGAVACVGDGLRAKETVCVRIFDDSGGGASCGRFGLLKKGCGASSSGLSTSPLFVFSGVTPFRIKRCGVVDSVVFWLLG